MSEEVKQEEIKKEGFFKKVIKSIKDFDKYEDFAIEKGSDAIKYFIKLLLIFCIIIAVAYTYNIVKNASKVYTSLKEKIPTFSYENGELKTDNDEVTIIEDYGTTIGSIIIDTKTESKNVLEDYSEQISKYGSAVIFLKNGFVVVNSNINGQAAYKYTDLLSSYNIQSGNKEQLINYIDGLSIISVSVTVFLMMIIYLFIAYFITTILDVLILTFLGYVSSRIFRIKIKMGVAFNIAVHAITLPMLLNLVYIVVNLFTGFNIKYFQIMYYAISYIYVIVAILMIKTEFINRQAELIKIAEEQMRVKEELEKQEEEQEQDKETENKKENENKPIEKGKMEKEKTETKEKKQSKSKKKEKSTDEPVGDASVVENEK